MGTERRTTAGRGAIRSLEHIHLHRRPASRSGRRAPWVFDGPVNGDIFRTDIARVLVPILKPGDVVVMDTLGSHKSQAVRQAIRTANAHLLFRCSGKMPHRGLF